MRDCAPACKNSRKRKVEKRKAFNMLMVDDILSVNVCPFSAAASILSSSSTPFRSKLANYQLVTEKVTKNPDLSSL